MQPAPLRVAVIGAGWAGLAAAIELTRAGRPVTLFEAGRVPGGRARSVTLDGRTLDNGQHLLLGAYRDTLSLLHQIGIREASVLQRLPLQVRDNTGFRMALPRLPAPLNLACGLLTLRGVSWREKWHTTRWMQHLKRTNFAVQPDQNVADWLDNAGQTGILRRHLWEPLCLAALNTQPREASARRFASVLRDSLGSPARGATDLLLPRVPLGEVFPVPACQWLRQQGAELRFGHRVRHVDTTTRTPHVDGEPFAQVIMAVAPQHLGKLWPDASGPAAYEPIATVYLQFAGDTHLPFPLLSLQGGIGQWIIDRGQGLLAAILSAHGAWETLDDNTLTARLADEILLGQPLRWARVIREQRATWRCTPDSPATGTRTAHPAIFLAGDHCWPEYPATLESAVRSGLYAARAMLNTD